MSLVKGLTIQSRVIHALILRETRTRFGRSKLGYLWALFEPISYIVVMIVIFGTISRSSPIGGEDNLPLFFMTGLIPWFMFMHVATKTMYAIDSNKALLAYPQVTPFDVLISRAILEMITLIIVLVIVTTILANLGYSHRIDSYLGLFASLGAIWMLATGVGFLNATIKLYLPSYDQTYNAIQRPFFFISGIFFLPETMPKELQGLLYYNPILHGVEWFRSAFFNNYESAFVDKSYLLAAGLVILTIGLSAQRTSRKMARQA
jgi:capsular polysaccharide transport system permease protein